MSLRRTRGAVGLGAVVVALGGGALVAASPATAQSAVGQYVVMARTSADYAGLKAEAASHGAKVVREVPELSIFVVSATSTTRSRLAASSRTDGVFRDHVNAIDTSERFAPRMSAPGLRGARPAPVGAKTAATATAAAATDGRADPAFHYRGLLWDYRRMGLPQGWQHNLGSPAVRVGVADTGVDYTHVDLRSKVLKVVDFTQDKPPLCFDDKGKPVRDRDLARRYGGPVTTDWNGHGSWIGGNIGAALNGTGTNGIAPKVGLVSLKISEWCGSSYTSSELAAFTTGARMGLDVVSISFGGYLPPGDADSKAQFRAYARAAAFAKAHGTVIVNSAGNAHVRIGQDGRITSHGSLTSPGTPKSALLDLHGWYRVPGGPPGFVVVSATNNRTVGASRHCPPGSTGEEDLNATCKPRSDRHDPIAVGHQDQLTYYSNYGPRIDIAAPGGARKFNLPAADRGGTPGFPYTNDDLTHTWETFSTTSNWALEIPCFTFTKGSGFPPGQCYTSIQGTSMAAPHVSAAIALIASEHPGLRHDVAGLIARVKADAADAHNLTPGLSATDKTPGDLFGTRCVTGFCHLGGPRIPDSDAYGAGIAHVR